MATAVFPCMLRVENVIDDGQEGNRIVAEVDVVNGCVVVGTPLVKIYTRPTGNLIVPIGIIIEIKSDNKIVDKALTGSRVKIQITDIGEFSVVNIGDTLVSKITRTSIDELKLRHKDEIDALKEEGWPLIQLTLKPMFGL